MKKLMFLILALALLMGVSNVSFAAEPAYENTIWAGGHGEYNKPMSEIIRVRYSGQGAVVTKIASGAVVLWDTTSGDGVSVVQSGANGDGRFAGVAVTDLLTQDTSDLQSARYGYICIRGYAIASIDSTVTAASTVGLQPSVFGGFANVAGASSDVAVLLSTSAGATANRPTGKVFIR